VLLFIWQLDLKRNLLGNPGKVASGLSRVGSSQVGSSDHRVKDFSI